MTEKPESEKLTHADVNFEHPAKMDDQCSTCQHFIPTIPMRCYLVKKPIGLRDWCDRYKAK